METIRSPSLDIVLASLNSFRAELNGLVAGSAAKTHDQLSIVGTVNLGGSQLVTSVGFSSVPGNTFRIIDNDGIDAIVGAFAGLAEGATFVANGFTIRISYRGGTGNDVVLTHLSNTAPAFQNRTVTATIHENGVVTVSGMITEPDRGDLFTLVVDWGDGNAPEEFNFDPAQGREVKVQHQYKDDPSDQPLDERIISLLWRDQHGASNIGDLVTTILNVAPNVVARPSIDSSLGTLLKGQGQFTDPGIDSWFATVDYGDGQGEKALPLSPDGKFNFAYQFTQAGLYHVNVKVTDDDGGTGESAFQVRVEIDNESQLYLLSWRNRRFNVDVDDDGEVTPLDVLLVINEINRQQSSDLLQRLSELDLSTPVYVDTNGDGYLSPLDVLLVINYLNKQSRETLAEGESSVPLAFALPVLESDQTAFETNRARSIIMQPSNASEVKDRFIIDRKELTSLDHELTSRWDADDESNGNCDLDELLNEISGDITLALRTRALRSRTRP